MIFFCVGVVYTTGEYDVYTTGEYDVNMNSQQVNMMFVMLL
jgi:hypothetical protein